MTRAALVLSDSLSIPLHATTGTFAAVGQRGTGKSSSAAVLVEQLVGAGGRAVVVDPTGVWWGLAHPGTGPGLAAHIFGGEHGDVPLAETGGQLVADVVLGSGQPVTVLDLKLLRKGQQVRFAAEFFEALYHGNREALHVVIDEAGRFAPQVLREPGGYGARLLGAIEDIVKLGRSRGLGCTLIEQRPAHIAKSVFEQTETLFAFRLMGPNDRKAIHGWIEAQGDPAREREVMDGMAKLKTGTALVWSPASLEYFGFVNFRKPETFDSRATPKVGATVRAPKKRAPVDLAALRTRMAETIELAKANDPKALRARIAELERELKAKPAAAAAAPAPAKVVEVPVLAEKDLKRLEAIAGRLAAKLDPLKTLAAQLADDVWQVRQSATERQAAGNMGPDLARPPAAGSVRINPRQLGDPGPLASRIAARLAEISGPTRRQSALGKRDDHDQALDRAIDLGRGERTVLVAIAQHPDGCTREQLTILTSYKRSTRDLYLQQLLKRDLIRRAGDRLVASDAGFARLGDSFEPLPTGDALREHWRVTLPEGERRVFEIVTRAYPKHVLVDEISEGTGYKRSTRDLYLQRLAARRLISRDRGEVQASEILFGGGA